MDQGCGMGHSMAKTMSDNAVGKTVSDNTMGKSVTVFANSAGFLAVSLWPWFIAILLPSFLDFSGTYALFVSRVYACIYDWFFRCGCGGRLTYIANSAGFLAFALCPWFFANLRLSNFLDCFGT